MAAPIYFDATYAGIPMLISKIETERGRDVVVQSPAQGDTHTLTDQGKRLRRTTCEIKFLDQPNRSAQESYLDRYDAFVNAFEDGEPHIFSHRLDGQYPARGENLTTTHDDESLCVYCTATFLKEDGEPAVFPSAAGVNPLAGVEAVETAVARTRNVLDEFELETVVPEMALAEVTGWAEAEELDSQSVFLGVASVTAQLDDAIAELELKSDLTLWPVFREMIQLRYEVVRAGAAFTSEAATVLDVFVDQPRPVLAICAEVYGAAEARDQAPKVIKLNRIRTPGRVPAGTTLKMPAAGAA